MSFISSVFQRGISTTAGCVGEMDFTLATFKESVSFTGTTFLEANFTFSKFFDLSLSFWGVEFKSVARFEFSVFENCSINFSGSKFLNNAWFSLVHIKGLVEFHFKECEFRERFDFSTKDVLEEGSEIKVINLSNSEFLKTVLFRQEKSENPKFVAVRDINFAGAIFRESLAIKFMNLKSPPDLSKTNLLDTKKLSLSEKSWEKNDGIDEQNISPDDEQKFRFLKKYFADQGNHFKEQQYFAYEMEAKRKRLLEEIKIPYLNIIKKLQNLFPTFLGKFMLKIVSIKNYLKNFSDLILFILYKWTSNFGMSWFRPLFCLFISFCCLGSLFEKINLENPYIKSFVRTFNLIFPLTSDVERFPLLMVTLTLQSLLNGCLIFLLILGLRNKFKIK